MQGKMNLENPPPRLFIYSMNILAGTDDVGRLLALFMAHNSPTSEASSDSSEWDGQEAQEAREA